jgi:protein-S-isoprenylcysteine O-methyltransferase Ste14
MIPSRKSPTVRRSRSERWETLKQEGLLGIVSMILATYGILIVGALYILNAPWIWWSYLLLPLSVRIAGVILSAISLAYLYWAGRVLAEHFSYTLEIQQDQKLVTAGPYHRVRHPIYTGTLAFLLFQVLVSDNWIFLLILIALIPYLVKRIRKEEEMMVEHFGQDYTEYMKRTGRLFPKLSQNHAK